MVRRPSSRARAAQWLLLLVLAVAAAILAALANDNLERRNTAFGFEFLGGYANFDIPFRLVPWHVGDTYARALLVSTLNTMLVSALAIVTASLLGLLVGIMRLSTNWLVRNVALCYVELIRNTPLLVQIIFFYVAVLQTLPSVRQSIVFAGGVLLNVRGLFLPSPVLSPDAGWWEAVAVVLIVGTPLMWRATWRGRPIGARALILPLLALGVVAAATETVEFPALKGFNIDGGIAVPPELVGLELGLTIYASAFIAEIVRSAILSVHTGQREAALSLGLRPGQVLTKVILPQALRVMVPPMTSQYLNIIKSSSLGAAIAYPELFQIFAGTVLNQTGRELETIMILMAIFLVINLATSAFMNWYNRRVMLVTR